MCRKSTSRPPPHRNHQIEVVPVREVRYTRLAVRTILAERFKLGLIFRGTHDHHVRPTRTLLGHATTPETNSSSFLSSSAAACISGGLLPMTIREDGLT